MQLCKLDIEWPFRCPDLAPCDFFLHLKAVFNTVHLEKHTPKFRKNQRIIEKLLLNWLNLKKYSSPFKISKRVTFDIIKFLFKIVRDYFKKNLNKKKYISVWEVNEHIVLCNADEV